MKVLFALLAALCLVLLAAPLTEARVTSQPIVHQLPTSLPTATIPLPTATIAATPPPLPTAVPLTVKQLIQQTFGRYAAQALRVATCESGLQPGAWNPTPIGTSHAAGVFQILYPSTWMTTPQGQAGQSVFNATANIMGAWSIFHRDHNTWREWACPP